MATVFPIEQERPTIARLPAGDIAAAFFAQARALLRQPEMVDETLRVVPASPPNLNKHWVPLALKQIEPLLDELFTAKRPRIVRLLADRADVRADGAAVRLRLRELMSLVRT